jgi:hypothetical protein
MLIHEYFGINLKTVWDKVQNDLPKLIERLTPLLKEEWVYKLSICNLQSYIAMMPTAAGVTASAKSLREWKKTIKISLTLKFYRVE